MNLMYRCLSLLGIVAAMILAPPAQAATNYCVTTSAGLQQALDAAEIDGGDSLIQLRSSGTYTLTTDPFYDPELEYIVPAGKLTIRGGYNEDCSAYSLTGASTLSSDGTHALYLFSSTGSISLAGLIFNRTHVMMGSLIYSECLANEPTLSLRRIRVDQASIEMISQCHDIVIDNSRFTNGAKRPDTIMAYDDSLRIVFVDFDDEWIGSATMVNSSVISGRLSIDGDTGPLSGSAILYNNIFDRPAGSDIFVSASKIFARNNRYDGINYSNGASLLAGSANNVNSNPDLSAQYIPNPGSPMINTGTSSVPGGLSSVDVAGGERVVGAGVDRGAHESPVSGNGVYTVTNTFGGNLGSLAAALDLANADPGPNTIRFNIPGSCPQRINFATTLQVRETVTFDGWSQPGSVLNDSEIGFNGVPCVILDGNGAIGVGIEALGNLGSGRIGIRGLAFEGFGTAILLPYGEDHGIYGNQFGGRIGTSGPVLEGNGDAITLAGSGRSVIGGYADNARNLIGNSTGSGILITGVAADDNEIINNLIGLDKNGASALPNLDGVRINTTGNRIFSNRIGGNSRDGIVVRSSRGVGNTIADNWIGGNAGSLSLVAPNGRMGIFLEEGAHDNTIGPDNFMMRNGDSAVRIMPTAFGRNRITANRMELNNSPGIDLGANGITPNDFDPLLCSTTTGCAANRGQNFPTLTEATRVRSGFYPANKPVRVLGRLNSIPGTFRIEFFASDTCYSGGNGQGARYLGSTNLNIAQAGICASGNCSASFSTYLPELDLDVGDVVTATATSSAGDTSEFSACVTMADEAGNDVIFADGFED